MSSWVLNSCVADFFKAERTLRCLLDKHVTCYEEDCVALRGLQPNNERGYMSKWKYDSLI